MMNKGFISFVGREIPSRKVVPKAIAPINSSRRVGELEMEKDYLSLMTDIEVILYMDKRGIRVAE